VADGFEDKVAIVTGGARGLGRAVVEQLSAAGTILNTASGLGLVGVQNAAAYTASKHAVVGLTKPAELASAAMFLLSDAGSYAVASVLLVDGGLDAGLYAPPEPPGVAA
jgi:NAD(P)-dependent dehydrogenase (short-subunit alcohol dehydrogenase family)